VSRSGFTEAGVRLAREAGLTLIGRAKGSRFVALSAPERIIFDVDAKMGSDKEQKSPQRQFNDAE